MGIDEAGWRVALAGYRDELSVRTEALWQKEAELARERANDAELRDAREAAAVDAREVLGRTRSLLDASNTVYSHRFGLDGPLPRGPKALESFGQNAVDMLLAADMEIEAMGARFSTVELARNIEAPIGALRQTLQVLREEERKAEELLTERNRLIDVWTLTYQTVAGILENLYRFAGEEELARRVRPTITRSSGGEAPEDGGEDVAGLVTVDDSRPGEPAVVEGPVVSE
ncbi:hypothetical protein DL240_02770 [Lujinxingia litoralis]|uniref:Uncharacterized protein n=2 Tax=Lujinxingia litoralis TaxID=2211119 RepID=A0A328CC07_9DELT|nr:hypothetical protein DL240_02770 [Lujinxingia litoralis]